MLNKLVKLTKKRKVIGRGGDRGGTSGKGHKGQKARSGGKIRVQFEGGQTNLARRLPKRGFSNARFKEDYIIISLDDLKGISEEFKIDSIKIENFIEYGKIKNSKEKIKLLSNGSLDIKLDVELNSCSASAKKLIESLGGSVKVL